MGWERAGSDKGWSMVNGREDDAGGSGDLHQLGDSLKSRWQAASSRYEAGGLETGVHCSRFLVLGLRFQV